MPVFTRDDLAKGILQGQTLIVYRGNVLRIPPKWLDKHPGGSLAILHFVGRDATDEVDAYHSEETLRLVIKYSVGTIQDGFQPFLPPIESGWVFTNGKWTNGSKQYRPDPSQILLLERDDRDEEKEQDVTPNLADIIPAPSTLSFEQQARQSAAYKRLHKRILDAGLYNCPYWSGYGPEVLRYVLLGITSAVAYQYSWFLTSALALGLMWHQLMFFVHDLGHMGVTHDWAIDRLISIIIANFIGGLSVGWWVDNHNVHHLVTNHPSHDPDIQHLPFFAITPEFFNNLYSSYYKRTMPFDLAARIFIPLQHKLFYIVMLFARFNLYRLAYVHICTKGLDGSKAKGGRWAGALELAGVVFFWYWFTKVLIGCGSWRMALGYVLVSHMATSPLHVQIVLSHYSMSTVDMGPEESFASRQLRTTTDVICPESVEFLHGGLHLQVTHHLFPRLPRHNLRKASLMVKEFAKEEGLSYAEFGFVDGNEEVLGVLQNVAHQVGIMANVAGAEAKEAVEKKIKQKEMIMKARPASASEH